MSASRIKYITQEFPLASSTWNGSVYTANTVSANSLLFSNVEVTLIGSTKTYTAPITVLANNQFSMSMNAAQHDQYHLYQVKGYLPGQTGPQSAQALQRGMATDAIVQSFVTGTGAAQYNIEVSLDTEHFINSATIIHNTTSGDTGFITVAPGWSHFRANITSVGANTLLTIITGN